MENFFAVVGAALVILIALALTAALFSLMFECFGKLLDRWRHDIIYRRDAEIGEHLKSGSYWLNEDPKLARLLKFLGNHIQRGQSMYPGHWRDEFYRAEELLLAPSDAKGGEGRK